MMTLRGRYVGGIQVFGPLLQAPQIISKTGADTVVIVCELEADWLKIVMKTLEPTGVKVTLFTLQEEVLAPGGDAPATSLPQGDGV